MRPGNQVNRTELRVLIGITALVGIMLLIGWVALHEAARMTSFERQYQARSIARGAALYAVYCSTCHGTDGRGIDQRAPALNNPQLFGYNFFAALDPEIATLQAQAPNLTAEHTAIVASLRTLNAASPTYAAELADLLARLQAVNRELYGEVGILPRLTELTTVREERLAALQPAIANGYPIYADIDADGNIYLVMEYARLDQLDWSGTLYDFIYTSLIQGRPTSVSYWGSASSPSQMLPWSIRAGGPLRDDQLADLTEYILNWDQGDHWTIEDALAVNQYAIEPSPRLVGGAGMVPPSGANVPTIIARLTEQGIVGDPARGETLYQGAILSGRGSLLGCSGCHEQGAVAPVTAGTWSRTVGEHLAEAQFTGYTPERYLIESIVRPGDYIVGGYVAGVMPAALGADMTLQDIADVIAYLRGQ